MSTQQQRGSAKDNLSGNWTAVLSGDQLVVTLENRVLLPDGRITSAFNVNELVGLSQGTQGAFSVVRDAGTLIFAGIFQRGKGHGTYRFIPNAFYREMMEEDGQVTESDQIGFFLKNITKSSVKMLKKNTATQGKKPENEQKGKQGSIKKQGVLPRDAAAVTEEFMKSFHQAGYTDIPASTLRNFKSIGVTPEFIKSFEQPGLKVPTYSDIINFKLVGVTPEYIKDFQATADSAISYSTIVNLKAAGASSPKNK